MRKVLSMEGIQEYEKHAFQAVRPLSEVEQSINLSKVSCDREYTLSRAQVHHRFTNRSIHTSGK